MSAGDQRKDYRGTASHGVSANNRHNNQDVRQNDSRNCKAIVISDKATSNADVLAQLHKDSNTGAVVSSSVPALSTDFQFDVSSEDGIQLFVDLNSDPSDWIESMKRGVHVCHSHDVHRHMLQGFQEDRGHLCSKQLKSSSVVDSDKQLQNGNFEDGCSPTRMGTAAEAQAGEPELGDRSLKSCKDTVHSQENMREKQTVLTLRMESDRENEISYVKSCEKADKKVPAISDANVLTKSRTCNSSGKSCDPKHSGTLENQVFTPGNDIFERSSPHQINGFLNPALKHMQPPASTSKEIHTSLATLGRDVGPASRTSKSLYLADQLQYSEGDNRGLPQLLQFHSNQHQLQSVEADEASRYGTCSNKSGSKKDKLHRAEVACKSRGQVTEAQTHLATCHRESMSLSPYQRHGSLNDVHPNNNVDIDNSNFLRPPEPGQGAVDVHSSPGRNGVSLDLVVPELNGAGHCILTCSNELEAENRKKQPATCAENVGVSNARDGKISSECLERDLMGRTCIKLTNSESNGEPKRKRRFSNVEGQQSNYGSSGSWILRTSNHSTKDVRARSSQFSNK